MAQMINIQPVTSIEGHAAIGINHSAHDSGVAQAVAGIGPADQKLIGFGVVGYTVKSLITINAVGINAHGDIIEKNCTICGEQCAVDIGHNVEGSIFIEAVTVGPEILPVDKIAIIPWIVANYGIYLMP